jgi:glycosyltransferase involved in cell wall biosynthesis
MASMIDDAPISNLSAAENARPTPMVSFVVLCYKLAHFLPECVNSILSQTYADFEVLIMDDQSPDNTAEVASSFADPRVKHVLNEKNLGFLNNENEGLRLSRGKYIWIISADDYLRRPYILERYVELMEKHPQVGYVFCSCVGVRSGHETGILWPQRYGERDTIVNGRVFLKKLLYGCIVLAPSAMARRECYEKISLFPLTLGRQIDVTWGADWYLWCIFALSCDVAYFAEPMICYREHELSFSSIMTQSEQVERCVDADLAVLWSVRQIAAEKGLNNVSKDCLRAIAHEYAQHGDAKFYRCGTSCMSANYFENSLSSYTREESERRMIRARFYAAKGNKSFSQGNLKIARDFYLTSLRNGPLSPKVFARLVLSLGTHGVYARRILHSLRKISS